MKIDYILLSCDDSPKFLSFLPSVSYHWRSMGYKIAFGLTSNTSISEQTRSIVSPHCDQVFYFENLPEQYPPIVTSKLCRYYIARHFLENTVCVQDIDYYVFDKHQHIEEHITLPKSEILTYAKNAYQNTCRYPATPAVGIGRLFVQMFLGDIDESYEAFLHRLNNFMHDKQITEPHANPPYLTATNFSDESLLTYINPQNGIQYKHVDRPDIEHGKIVRRLDPRSGSLNTNNPIDIQPIRPLQNDTLMRQVFEKIGIPAELLHPYKKRHPLFRFSV